MNIGIIGCGWLGCKIAEKLLEKHNIFSTTTRQEKLLVLEKYNPTLVSFSDKVEENKRWEIIELLDVLIITVPFSERRNSLNSLEIRFKNISNFIGDFKGQLFFMSSTGVYPKTFRIFSENDLLSEDNFIENSIQKKYPQVNILRLAGLMGGKRLLKNYTVSNVRDVVNHIHFTDVCLVIEQMIFEKSTEKTYNVVAPVHPTKQNVINAQQNLPLQEKFEKQQRIISSKKMISELKFEFRYPNPMYFHL